jgi:hypothetical protein
MSQENSSWKSLSSKLRKLEDRIRAHQGKFRAAGYDVTADDLERAVRIVVHAEKVAMLASLGGPSAADLERARKHQRSMSKVRKPRHR